MRRSAARAVASPCPCAPQPNHRLHPRGRSDDSSGLLVGAVGGVVLLAALYFFLSSQYN